MVVLPLAAVLLLAACAPMTLSEGTRKTVATQVLYYVFGDQSLAGTRLQRSTTPTSAAFSDGRITSRANEDGSVTISVVAVSGFVVSGIVIPLGTLESVSKVTVSTTTKPEEIGDSVALWIDVNHDGEYFSWRENALSWLEGDRKVRVRASRSMGANGAVYEINDNTMVSLLGGKIGLCEPPFVTYGRLRSACGGLIAGTKIALEFSVLGVGPPLYHKETTILSIDIN